MSGDFRPCIVIPCLDGEGSIGAVVRGAVAQGYPVFVIDDGSTDKTVEEAEASGAQVVRHPVNQGKGAALLSGLKTAAASDFTHVVTLDADGQHNPSEIPALVAASKAQPNAIVIGARDFETDNVPGSSKFGRNFSNFWVRLWTGHNPSDTQSGFRVYPASLTTQLQVKPSHFEWEVEVLVRAGWAGMPLVDVPISVFYPPADERVSHYRGFVDSTRITMLHFRLLPRWLIKPLFPTRRLVQK